MTQKAPAWWVLHLGYTKPRGGDDVEHMGREPEEYRSGRDGRHGPAPAGIARERPQRARSEEGGGPQGQALQEHRTCRRRRGGDALLPGEGGHGGELPDLARYVAAEIGDHVEADARGNAEAATPEPSDDPAPQVAGQAVAPEQHGAAQDETRPSEVPRSRIDRAKLGEGQSGAVGDEPRHDDGCSELSQAGRERLQSCSSTLMDSPLPLHAPSPQAPISAARTTMLRSRDRWSSGEAYHTSTVVDPAGTGMARSVW